MRKTTKIKLLFPLAIFILIAVSVGASVRAQELTEKIYLPAIRNQPLISARWIGPEGGTVTVLASDPYNQNILYAGTLGTGVFKTVNGGTSWGAANQNMKNLPIVSLAIDPKNSSILYAGTEGQGIYKSTDSGASWNAVNTGIAANAIVYGLAVNPGNNDLVFAGTRTKGTNNGVLYKSVNKGANWTAVFSKTGNWFTSLAIDPNKPQIILAATEYSGPYINMSYGASNSWGTTTITSGDRTSGRAVAFDPRSGTERAYFSAWNNDFYKSEKNGSEWSLSDSGLSDSNISLNGITIDPNNSNRIFLAANKSSVAGVIKSDNLGQNWYAAGLKGKQVNSVAAPRGASNTIYAGVQQDGVYKSTDGGANWVRKASGLGASYVTGMAFSGTSTYYSATYGGGILKSTNAGTSWADFNTNLGDLNINGLVQHPTQPNILFALTSSSGLRRVDLNTTNGWSASEGLPQQFDRPNIALRDDPETAVASAAVGINGMAFAPSNPNIAYLATNGGGVYASSNSASSFAPKGLTNEVVKSVAVNWTDPNILYVSTSTKGIVKKSTDGGNAWVSMGLPEAQLQKDVNIVAMWPGDADKVCAGTTNGVWKFNGTSWEAAGLQGYTISSLVPDRQAIGMFAGTERGAFYSTDLVNWTAIESSIASTGIASINFNPAPAEWSIIYLGTTERGALRTNLYR